MVKFGGPLNHRPDLRLEYLDAVEYPADDGNGAHCYSPSMNIKDFSDDAFAGYLAAFLDGEGCIEINVDECGVRLRLANTYRPTLDAMCARLEMGRVEEYRGRSAPHHKRIYCYAVSSAPDVERFLLIVRPYLTIKTEKADRALTIIGHQRKRMEELDDSIDAASIMRALSPVERRVAAVGSAWDSLRGEMP